MVGTMFLVVIRYEQIRGHIKIVFMFFGFFWFLGCLGFLGPQKVDSPYTQRTRKDIELNGVETVAPVYLDI